MDRVKTLLACLFAMTLCGCGPSAKQVAEQQARQKFREAVAAVKVCTQGATYSEFREKRLALETYYTANQAALAQESKEIEHLAALMKSTDIIWDWQIQYTDMALPSGRARNGFMEEKWEAMLLITPAVAAKADFTPEQCRKDPDFYAKNYVRRGLTLISTQCDELLAIAK